jgi:tetratricopeptide (TPR) repeat protein
LISLRYQEQGDLDRAIADYDAVVRAAPKADDAFYGRALAWLAKGDAAHAMTDAGEAIAVDAGLINAYWLRGRLRFATGDFSGAVADLRHMLDQWHSRHAVTRAPVTNVPCADSRRRADRRTYRRRIA